jgi:hypothetical protein
VLPSAAFRISGAAVQTNIYVKDGNVSFAVLYEEIMFQFQVVERTDIPTYGNLEYLKLNIFKVKYVKNLKV